MKLVYGSHLKDEDADVLAARLAGPHRPSAQPRAAPALSGSVEEGAEGPVFSVHGNHNRLNLVLQRKS